MLRVQMLGQDHYLSNDELVVVVVVVVGCRLIVALAMKNLKIFFQWEFLKRKRVWIPIGWLTSWIFIVKINHIGLVVVTVVIIAFVIPPSSIRIICYYKLLISMLCVWNNNQSKTKRHIPSITTFVIVERQQS